MISTDTDVEPAELVRTNRKRNVAQYTLIVIRTKTYECERSNAKVYPCPLSIFDDDALVPLDFEAPGLIIIYYNHYHM